MLAGHRPHATITICHDAVLQQLLKFWKVKREKIAKVRFAHMRPGLHISGAFLPQLILHL